MALLHLTGLKQPIDPQTIIAVTGESNYIWLHCMHRQKYLLALTLIRIEEQLPGFIRIHKSSLINPHHVTELDNLAQQLMNVELSNGTILGVARRRIQAVRQQLDQLGIPMLKPSVQNIMTWWFAADTPIRHYKLTLNPTLQWACEQVSQQFTPPSGATTQEAYRRVDKLAFAKAVEKLIDSTTKPSAEKLSQN